MTRTILLVEDEPSIADNLIYALETERFNVVWKQTGAEALALIRSEHVALAVLDVGLPDCNGFDLYREIRRIGDLPVIFLTARSHEVDRVAGLEMGADDYVIKPFSPREVTARVRAVLRRIEQPPPPGRSVEEDRSDWFTIDETRYQIAFAGRPIELSRYEFRLLSILIRNPGRVFSREQLMSRAWEEPDMSLERTVDTHIKTIRKKLRELAPSEELIITHRGLGYSLKEPA